MNNEFNFLIGRITQADKDLFFGPLSNQDQFIELRHDCLDMADIMVIANIFTSKTRANKANMGGPIPRGFTDFKVGKHKTRITILKLL